jgi:hypothetical protein
MEGRIIDSANQLTHVEGIMQSKIFKLVSVVIMLAIALAGFSVASAQPQATVATLRESLFLSDTQQRADGISLIFRVAIDQVGGRVNLTLLPNGQVPFDNVDALAVSPDGARVYMIDDGLETYPNATLAYYDLATDQVVTVGGITFNGANLYKIDQATFSAQGVLYITQNDSNALYTVDPETAVATEIGPVVDQATGQTVDIYGADIAFTADGSLYLVTNSVTTALYGLTLPDGPGVVNAALLGPTGDNHRVRGMAVRANGYGDIVVFTQQDQLHVIDRTTGADLIRTLPLYWNGSVFDAINGDMSTGAMALCNSPKIFWETNSWGGLRVTVLGVPIDETFGQEIMVKAHWANFSKMVAQLVTAKLNVNNATGLAVIDDAEAWLATQGLVKADGTLYWNKPFESKAQQDAAWMYFVSLRQFNESNPCQIP